MYNKSLKLIRNMVSHGCRPKSRYIRVNHDDFFDNAHHTLSNLPTKAEKMCRYDLDVSDITWLELYNGERAKMGMLEDILTFR